MATVNQATRAQGVADLSDVEDRRVYTPDEIIGLTGDTDDSPYFRIWGMLRRESNPSFKIQVYRDENFPSKTRAAAAQDSSTGTVVVEDYKTIVAGTILHIPRTGEALRATATPSSTTVAVTRGLGDTDGAAILVGDVIIIGQTAVTEGSSPVDTYSSEPWKEHNYIETRRHGWKVTRHATLEEIWGQKKLEHEAMLHLIRFKREIETSLLLGQKLSTTVSGSQLYLSGGIEALAKESGSRALVVNFDGVALTRMSLDARIREYYRQKNSGGDVVALCGENILTILSGWVHDKLQINEQATDIFGTAVYRYQCTNGEVLNFIPHRMWTHEWDMQDKVWLVDIDKLSLAGVPGGPSEITYVNRAKDITSKELAAVGTDYFWNELWIENGLKLKGTENIAIFENING